MPINTLFDVYADLDPSGPVEMLPDNFIMSAPLHVVAKTLRLESPAVQRIERETVKATDWCRLHLNGRSVPCTDAPGVIVARVPPQFQLVR